MRQPEPMPAGGAVFQVVMLVRWAEEGTERNIAAVKVQIRITCGFDDEAASPLAKRLSWRDEVMGGLAELALAASR